MRLACASGVFTLGGDVMSRRLLSILFGNLFEHYDQALYGLLFPFLAPVFFPDTDPIVALILASSLMPLGRLIRPLGALFFGVIGDNNRKKALALALIGMAALSVCMGCIPTHAQIGYLSAGTFIVLRLLQNFFASGESIGGAVHLLEQVKPSKRDLASSLFNMSTVGGILVASLLVTWFALTDRIYPGWRYLYFFGGITACFGFALRISLKENRPIREKRSLMTQMRDLWQLRRLCLVIIVASGFMYATYSVALVMMNGFVPLVSDVSRGDVMSINTVMLLFDFLLLPFFGKIASKMPRAKMMLYATLLTTIGGVPLFMLLGGASFFTVCCVRISLVILGVFFSATYHSWSQSLIPEKSRYAAISLSYAIGTQLLGAPTVPFSLWLYKVTGLPYGAALYWVFLSGMTGAILVWQMRTYAEKGELVKSSP